MGFRKHMKHTRRCQAMTEYIVLVGLIALGLIAAVSHFGFRVDEAIQGSEMALKTRMDPPPASGQGNPGTIHDKLFSTTDSGGQQYDVHRINDGNGGWKLVVTPPGGTPTIGSAEYSSSTHGTQTGRSN